MSQKKPLCFSLVLPMELGDFFFCAGWGGQGAIYALKKKNQRCLRRIAQLALPFPIIMGWKVRT